MGKNKKSQHGQAAAHPGAGEEDTTSSSSSSSSPSGAPTPLPPLTEKESTCFAALTAWAKETSPTLDDAGRAFLTPATLRRYAVARNGDVKAAISNLEETIQWRKENVPSYMHCTACDADPHSHAFFPLGIDSHRRVVVYACSARAKMNETAVTVGHMCQTLEHAWSHTEELNLHPQWLWLVDFNGFGLSHALQGRTSNAALAAFSTHMPERLGAVVLINPPRVFDILLAAIKPFIDARTLGKVHIVRCTKETAGEVLAPFGVPVGSGMSAWMSEVMGMEGKPNSIPAMDGLDQAVLKVIQLNKGPAPGAGAGGK
jgi:hypothetical protein